MRRNKQPKNKLLSQLASNLLLISSFLAHRSEETFRFWALVTAFWIPAETGCDCRLLVSECVLWLLWSLYIPPCSPFPIVATPSNHQLPSDWISESQTVNPNKDFPISRVNKCFLCQCKQNKSRQGWKSWLHLLLYCPTMNFIVHLLAWLLIAWLIDLFFLLLLTFLVWIVFWDIIVVL